MDVVLQDLDSRRVFKIHAKPRLWRWPFFFSCIFTSVCPIYCRLSLFGFILSCFLNFRCWAWEMRRVETPAAKTCFLSRFCRRGDLHRFPTQFLSSCEPAQKEGHAHDVISTSSVNILLLFSGDGTPHQWPHLNYLNPFFHPSVSVDMGVLNGVVMYDQKRNHELELKRPPRSRWFHFGTHYNRNGRLYLSRLLSSVTTYYYHSLSQCTTSYPPSTWPHIKVIPASSLLGLTSASPFVRNVIRPGDEPMSGEWIYHPFCYHWQCLVWMNWCIATAISSSWLLHRQNSPASPLIKVSRLTVELIALQAIQLRRWAHPIHCFGHSSSHRPCILSSWPCSSSIISQEMAVSRYIIA